MPVDPIIARPYVPQFGTTLREALRTQVADDYRSALLQQDRDDFEWRQRQAAEAQAQALAAEQQEAEEERLWDEAYARRDWGTLARIDPQTARALFEFEREKQAPAYAINEQPGPFGSRIVSDGSRFQVVEPQRPAAAGGGGAAHGKPPAGYRWTADGNLESIPGGPQDKPAMPALSAKDANTARVKLTQVKVARDQLETAKQRYAALKDTFSAGMGGKILPTPKGKAFDAAIDSMRGSITALTRVPGIGAMSDFETRLDQAKFPTRNAYEAVGEQQLGALEQLLDTIEGGYSELLGRPTPQRAAPRAVGGPQQSGGLTPEEQAELDELRKRFPRASP